MHLRTRMVAGLTHKEGTIAESALAQVHTIAINQEAQCARKHLA